MRPDTNHSNDNVVQAAAESSQVRAFSGPSRLARRSFLRNLGLGAVLLAPGASLLSGSAKARDVSNKNSNSLTRIDAARADDDRAHWASWWNRHRR